MLSSYKLTGKLECHIGGYNWYCCRIGTEQLIFKNSTTTMALENRQRMIYVLPILIIAATVLFIVNTTLYWFLAKKASISIHKLLLSKIVNSSIEFFNSHFAGNILNRFSEDMLYLDEFVPRTFYDMLRVSWLHRYKLTLYVPEHCSNNRNHNSCSDSKRLFFDRVFGVWCNNHHFKNDLYKNRTGTKATGVFKYAHAIIIFFI